MEEGFFGLGLALSYEGLNASCPPLPPENDQPRIPMEQELGTYISGKRSRGWIFYWLRIVANYVGGRLISFLICGAGAFFLLDNLIDF